VSVTSSVDVTTFKVVVATVVVLTSSMVVGSAVVDVDATSAMVPIFGKIVVSGTAGTTSGTKALCLLAAPCSP